MGGVWNVGEKWNHLLEASKLGVFKLLGGSKMGSKVSENKDRRGSAAFIRLSMAL